MRVAFFLLLLAQAETPREQQRIVDEKVKKDLPLTVLEMHKLGCRTDLWKGGIKLLLPLEKCRVLKDCLLLEDHYPPVKTPEQTLIPGKRFHLKLYPLETFLKKREVELQIGSSKAKTILVRCIFAGEERDMTVILDKCRIVPALDDRRIGDKKGR